MPTYVGQARAPEQGLEVPVDDVLGVKGCADGGGGEYEAAITPSGASPNVPLAGACGGLRELLRPSEGGLWSAWLPRPPFAPRTPGIRLASSSLEKGSFTSSSSVSGMGAR